MKSFIFKILIAVGLVGIAFAAALALAGPSLGSIESQLINKTSKEKANIVATELAKLNFVGTYENARYGVKIEIQSVSKIEIAGVSGIEIISRAWKLDGTPLGFGADGTAEWERHRIYNIQRVTISDPNGNIIHEYVEKEVTKQLRLREDPIVAIQTILAGITKLGGQESKNIIKGKVGNTDSTFYPAAGINYPVDGYWESSALNKTFADIRDETSSGAYMEGEAITSPYLISSTDADQFNQLRRAAFGFETSPIGTDTISTSTLALYATEKAILLGDTDIDLVGFTPSNPGYLTNNDYNITNFGSTRLATGLSINDDISLNDWNYFGLNAAGIAFINSQGGNLATSTFFGLLFKWDLDNNFTGSWTSAKATRVIFRHADYADLTYDPYLFVVHAATAAGGGGGRTGRINIY